MRMLLKEKYDRISQFIDQIPSEFDHVIEFAPEIPPGPHSDQQHDEIDQWQAKFSRLMEIEYASSSKKG